MKRKTKDDNPYKPFSSSSSSSASKKRKSDSLKFAQQHVSLKDLLSSGLLTVGQRIYVKEQEAEVTEDGTIKVVSGSKALEFKNPTSWTRHATGRESGGWSQIRLKPSNDTLSTIKDKYIQGLMDGTYEPTFAAISGDAATEAVEENDLADVDLPINVRFAGDDAHPFKITWVSPDYKEFHFEYRDEKFSSLAAFSRKIYADMQGSTPPTTPNFSFNTLVYEVEGKWLESDQINEANLSREHTSADVSSSSDARHADTTNSNNSSQNGDDGSKKGDDEDKANNDGDDVINDNHNNSNSSSGGSSNNNSTNASSTPTTSASQFKILLQVEDETPARVNATASNTQELLAILLAESGLHEPNPSDYDVALWDDEFSEYIKLPKHLSSIPAKCRVNIRKKKQTPPSTSPTKSVSREEAEEKKEGEGEAAGVGDVKMGSVEAEGGEGGGEAMVTDHIQ